MAELPTGQKTLAAFAPLMSFTLLADAMMSVDAAWKMKTAAGLPWASRVRVPVIPNVPRGRVIHPGRHRGPAQFHWDGGGDRAPGRVIVRGSQVSLGLQCDAVGRVDRPVYPAGRKPCHRCARAQPEIALDRGHAGVRDSRRREDRELGGAVQRDRPSRRVIAPASMAARASRGRVVVREFFREPNRTHWGSFIGSA